MITSKSNWINYRNIMDNSYDNEFRMYITCRKWNVDKEIVVKRCNNAILVFDDKNNFLTHISLAYSKMETSKRMDLALGLSQVGEYDVMVIYRDENGDPDSFRFTVGLI